MMRGKSFIAFFLLPLILGCMVGPDYRRPSVSVPDQWLTDVEGDPCLVNMAWWTQFEDPVLTDLIHIALRENRDVAIATGRIQEFAALYGIALADVFPIIEEQSSYLREKISQKVTPLPAGTKNPDNIYQALLSGTWEIDLWGKIRREAEAVRSELLATTFARKSIIQTLVSSVAIGYINLLSLDKQLEISISTAKTRLDSLHLFQKRYDAGVISQVTLSQIESEYSEALARIPEFRKSIAFQEHALSVLLGKNPMHIPRGKTIDDLAFPDIPAALPSVVLCQRPDIGEAEGILAAANARIGVARAEYFPSLALTGDYGNASRELRDLFTGEALSWNHLISVSVPIFTAGRISGNVRAKEAVKYQALAGYQRSILEAFRQVEDALSDLTETKNQLDAKRQQVEALKRYARLARLRYDEGYTSYLEVLDAERSLFNVELDYTDIYSTRFEAVVLLYKSLGGGWPCTEPCTE